jgi:hypothetical protein
MEEKEVQRWSTEKSQERLARLSFQTELDPKQIKILFFLFP